MEPRVAAGNSGLDVFFRLPKGNWVLGATHKVEVLLPEREDLIAVPASAIYGDNRVYRITKIIAWNHTPARDSDWDG